MQINSKSETAKGITFTDIKEIKITRKILWSILCPYIWKHILYQTQIWLLYLCCCCCCCCCCVASVVSDSVRPHRQQPTRPRCPWDSPGKNTGVGCHFLLQCMRVKSESEVAQSCLTLSDPMDCSLPGSSVHGIFQVRVLEWVAIAFSDICVMICYKMLCSVLIWCGMVSYTYWYVMITLTSQWLKHNRSFFLAHAVAPLCMWVGTCLMQWFRDLGWWRMKLLYMYL